MNGSQAGIAIDDFGAQDFENAWVGIQQLVSDPDIKAKARALAERVFDLEAVGAERYARLYEEILTTD